MKTVVICIATSLAICMQCFAQGEEEEFYRSYPDLRAHKEIVQMADEQLKQESGFQAKSVAEAQRRVALRAYGLLNQKIPYWLVIEVYNEARSLEPEIAKMSLPEFARTANEVTGSSRYDEGLNDNWLRRVGTNIERSFVNSWGVVIVVAVAGLIFLLIFFRVTARTSMSDSVPAGRALKPASASATLADQVPKAATVINKNVEQEKRQKKNPWSWSWKIDQADLQNQVENYNGLKITQSYRGICVLIVNVILVLTLVLSFFGRHDDPTPPILGVILTIVIFLPVLFFVYKGHRWALVLVMVWWTLEKGYQIFGQTGSGRAGMAIAAWLFVIPYFRKALKVENERRKLAATASPKPADLSIDISFNCPRCGQHLCVEERGAGMAVNCPSCNEQIEIPRSTVPATAPRQSPPIPVGSSPSQSTEIFMVQTPVKS